MLPLHFFLLWSVFSGQFNSGDAETSVSFIGDIPVLSSNSVDDTITNSSDAKNISSYCKEPVKPNLSTNGLRTSMIQCSDYIWQMSYRDQVEKNAELCEAESSEDGAPVLQIVGGRVTKPAEYPHMGAIGWKAVIGTWIFKCGSSLISPKYVLTAAHCTEASDRDSTVADTVPKIIRLGDNNIKDITDGVAAYDANINKIIPHPSYSAPKKYNDIALMELEAEVTFTKLVQPACLWNKFDTTTLGNKATVTGWGVIETGSLKTSPELRVGDVDLIDSLLCDDLLGSHCNRNWCGLKDSQICAGNLTGGVDSCQGDSGGPLQVKIQLPISSQGQMHFIVGITSFGFGCALDETPGVYTRVSYYIDWIESIVWP